MSQRVADGKFWLAASALLVLSLFGSAGIGAPGKARPGTVTVVEVRLPARANLDELIAEDFNIANVRRNTVTIYAAEQELGRLPELGYDYRIVDTKTATKDLGSYHDYASLTTELQAYAANEPNICRLHSLGQSVQGREIWAMLITDNPEEEEDEPEFRYIGAIHGDESLGAEMCLYFIDMLLSEYDNANPRIADIVDSTAIWIVPLMNPDGLEADSRYNADGYDLNRMFPSYPNDFTGNIFDGEPLGDTGPPVEVAHLMRWSAENSFILGGEFHTGSLVVNYPYDDDGLGSVDSPTPDDLLFEDISRRYSMYNPPMWNSTEFYQGISNGAAWYSITGGMEDWCYRYLSCNDVIIEISNDYQPPSSQIPYYWDDNRDSMLSYLEAVHIGVRGVVIDHATSQPIYAKITVADNSHPVFTDPDVGDYHRMLLPGQYDLTFSAPGYLPQTVTGVIVGEDAATRVDVELVFDADLSGDDDIDFQDFAIFAEKWQTEACPGCPGDYSGDGRIDAEDLVRLMSSWLAGSE